MSEIKEFKFQIKTEEKLDEGLFEGFLAVYGNVDSQGDAIQPGAFEKTLRDNGGRFPLLWQHDSREPIGSLDVQDRPRGLFVQGRLLLDVSRAREAHSLLKAKIVKGLSIGYMTVRSRMQDGIRQLLELKLMEGSLVSFASNPQAQVTSVKSILDDPEALQRLIYGKIAQSLSGPFRIGEVKRGDGKNTRYPRLDKALDRFLG